MKIASIDTYVLFYPEPNDYSSQRCALLVKVTTSDGVEGWGEGIAQFPEATKAAVPIVEGLFEVIKDENPLEIEKIWHKMRDHTWWYGRSGIANFAVSAIDIALWDIKGKVLGAPLYELLGGKVTEKLPANACIHVNHPTPEETVEVLEGYIHDQGYQSCKLGFAKKGPSPIGKVSPDIDVKFVADLRLALGDTPDIMVDAGNGVKWDVPTAVRTTQRMMESNIRWMEEPLYPTDILGYKELRSKVGVSIASGEREWNVEGYQALLDTDTVDVFGVDPGRVEGITGYMKIQYHISAKRRFINAHAWSTAITTAASLHCSHASNNSIVFELKPIPGPAQFDLVSEPIVQNQGWVAASDRPGLGIDVHLKTVEKYCVQHMTFKG
ncbi:mandelate racemase/muconate lactonizing enzyme family protein [Vibrio sp. SCSIO 43132]|uniref:mandelate racemase/muconate lactonizing enzyme family protein n=1 Tax=Vibrio sp. SCSIO 43132 TaxID=2779363 RepID=UPI001CAA32F3|nr:mandelate racemase/muconate lactonizing enzyme family protein [Vibrio sp. SCSIO 43132]